MIFPLLCSFLLGLSECPKVHFVALRFTCISAHMRRANQCGGGQGGIQSPLPSPSLPTSLPLYSRFPPPLSPLFPPPLSPLPSPSLPAFLPLSPHFPPPLPAPLSPYPRPPCPPPPPPPPPPISRFGENESLCLFHPYMANRLAHHYQLGGSTFIFRDIRSYFKILFTF